MVAPAFFGDRLVRRMTTVKNSGVKNTPRTVAASIPPNTPVPSELRLPAPAPVAMTSGTTPRMNAKLVMRIGRKRSLAAWIAASRNDSPFPWRTLANSTMRMAFFAASPTTVTRPMVK